MALPVAGFFAAASPPPQEPAAPPPAAPQPGAPPAAETTAAEAPAAAPATAAPPLVLEHTEVRTLASRHAGVGYKLYVGLPESYAESDERYPVVYLLDADYSFLLARNITQHLSQRDDLDEVLLVGIAYDGPLRYRLNRTRDYTPTHVPTGGYGPEYQKVSGGGESFRRFLAEELQPFIDRTYRTRPGETTLVGHSYGGLFGTWVLLTEPELFSRYILVSPSLWYDDHLPLRLEAELAERRDSLPARVYFCVGSREVNSQRDMIADLRRFTARLEERGYEGLELRVEVFDDETHNSVFPTGLGRGLRYVHRGR